MIHNPVRTIYHQGFTAVELLVTLFVAALFLVAGYQLFNLIMTDSGNTRAEAAISNVTYDYMRRYADSATTNPCTSSTPLTNEQITINGVAEPSITVTITCPQGDAPSLSKVEVFVNYLSNSDEPKVFKHATYADKSKGASPNSDVTDGLVAWWRLNENANSSVGSHHGTTTATTPATGQNGQGASAFEFNGAASVQVQLTNALKPDSSFSVTFWFRAPTHTVSRPILSTTEGGGWSFYQGGGGCVQFQVYNNGSYTGNCASMGSAPVNTWYFAAGVYNRPANTVYTYVYTSSSPTTVSASAPTANFRWPLGEPPLCLGAEPGASKCVDGYFTGALDDVRFYSKALSLSEVQQLRNGGAK